MVISDLHFMSIGGNCACIGFLGKYRTRGPVDNVILGNPKTIDLLLQDKYFEFITTSTFIQEPRKKSWPEDYDYFSKYPNDMVWIAHHDPTTQKYRTELKKRCSVFKDFYQKVISDPNYYFVFNLNEFCINKKQDNLLNHAFVLEVINILKSYNLLEKTIFVGTRVQYNKATTWNYNSDDFNDYISKYNLKYVEIVDNNIWETDAPSAEFINKVYRLLNNITIKKWGNVVVAIAKNEEKYINNWCNYYLSLGFDKVFIYDNNELSKGNLLNYIDRHLRHRVTIIDRKGQHKTALQQECYNHFIQNYYKLFNWCAFIDLDEFITGLDNINELLSSPAVNNAKQIRIKWHLFGDDDVIERDIAIPPQLFFKNIINDKGKYSHAGKCIIRGGIANIKMYSVHYASTLDSRTPITECYPSGKLTYDGIVITEDQYTDETIYINHYMTKTLAEFIDQKLGRGDAVKSKRKIDMSYFFEINKISEAKLKFIQERGLEYNDKS